MGGRRFHLVARVSSDHPAAIRPTLTRFLGPGGVLRATPDGFEVTGDLQGTNARDLNRRLLSEVRRVEKRTRLRAEWTAGGTTERFFDYVPKGTHPEAPAGGAQQGSARRRRRVG